MATEPTQSHAGRRRTSTASSRVGVSLVSLGVAGVAAISVGASSTPSPLAEPAASPPRWAKEAATDLSVEQQVGQVVIGGFNGSSAPRPTRSALMSGRLSGVILFRGNVRSADQLRGLSRSVQRAAHGTALVSVDQEGGLVRRIPFAGPRQGQPSQGSVARVGRLARSAGRTLSRLGLNVNFAPVADVPSGPGADIYRRAFRGSP
jgi:beta-N-acetylhexosaminidase